MGASRKARGGRGNDRRRSPRSVAPAPPAHAAGPGASLVDLQRAIGNRAVLRLASGEIAQAKLQVGPAGDRYEQEADRVADEVMRSLGAPAGPSVATEDLGERVRRRPMEDVVGLEGGPLPDAAEASIMASRGQGRSLPSPVRSFMERAFDANFDDVRVHADSASTHQLQARAFTVGQDIHFAPGQYQPATSGGQRLLAHELTHVVQQTGGGARAPRDAGTEALEEER